jgi:hypothetical protein
VFCYISEDGGECDTQQERVNWSDRDWDDYNYVPPAGGACGGQGAGMRDPLAELCDDLPGLIAGDITASLRDLPIPTQGDVPGMTVEEAIEVLFCVYKGLYHGLYHGILHGIYHCLYHGIYHDIYRDIYHEIYHDLFCDIYLCINHVTNIDTNHSTAGAAPSFEHR